LPSLRAAWYSRNKFPLAESIQFTLLKFQKIWRIDGLTEKLAIPSFAIVRIFGPR
jgi:hypothetical protein